MGTMTKVVLINIIDKSGSASKFGDNLLLRCPRTRRNQVRNGLVDSSSGERQRSGDDRENEAEAAMETR
ncbi:hypothetical protein YC2023_088874 [Brassica napus]